MMRKTMLGLGLTALAACSASPANDTAKAPDNAAFIVSRIRPATVSGKTWAPAGVSLTAQAWRWSETGDEGGDREISVAPGDLLRPGSVERTTEFWEVRFTCRTPGCISVEDKGGEKRVDSIAWNFTGKDDAALVGRVANQLLQDHGAQPRPF